MESEESSGFILPFFPNFLLLFMKVLVLQNFLLFSSVQIYKMYSELAHINGNHLRDLAPKSSLSSEIHHSGSGSLSHFIPICFQPRFSDIHPSDQTRD